MKRVEIRVCAQEIGDLGCPSKHILQLCVHSHSTEFTLEYNATVDDVFSKSSQN